MAVTLLENTSDSKQNKLKYGAEEEAITASLVLQFVVEDEGIGIPKESQKHIFDYFGQADNSLSRHFGGSGLGLSISRELVQLLGGDPCVESPSRRSACGSVFHFAIPLKVAQEKHSARQGIPLNDYLDALKKAAEKKKVLLVEDNLVNQQIALAMLEKAGLKADIAENGQLALEALDKEAYALVLMDLQMPVMDGLSATRHIRSNAAFSDLPIVALTAQVLDGDREACLAVGMNDYVPKPIKPEDLYKTLHHYLCD